MTHRIRRFFSFGLVVCWPPVWLRTWPFLRLVRLFGTPGDVPTELAENARVIEAAIAARRARTPSL